MLTAVPFAPRASLSVAKGRDGRRESRPARSRGTTLLGPRPALTRRREPTLCTVRPGLLSAPAASAVPLFFRRLRGDLHVAHAARLTPSLARSRLRATLLLPIYAFSDRGS